jgi:hypothetical protein
VELVGIEPFQWIENIQLADSTMFSKVKKGTNPNSAVQIGTRTSCRLLHTSIAQTRSRTYWVSTKPARPTGDFFVGSGAKKGFDLPIFGNSFSLNKIATD